MIKKIEIPITEIPITECDGSDTTLIDSEDWLDLVSQIEAVNEEIEGMTKVYLDHEDYTDEDFLPCFKKTACTKYYAYITKPQPIKKKTKEERAMELVEEIAYYDFSYSDNFRRKARAILEESEET